MTSKLDNFPSNEHLLMVMTAVAWSASNIPEIGVVGWATLLIFNIRLVMKWFREDKAKEPKP